MIFLLLAGLVTYGFLIWFSNYTWKCIHTHGVIIKSPFFMWASVTFLWAIWTLDYYFIYYLITR